MASRRSIIWIDAGGRTRQTSPTTASGAATLMADLQAHSNADVLTWWEGTAHDLVPHPVSAQYPDVKDTAILTFSDASGILADVTLVAPKSNIFLPDGITVDSTAIAVLIADTIGNLLTTSGTAVSSYVAGIRRGRSFNA